MDIEAFARLLTPEGQAALARVRDLATGDELAAAVELRRSCSAELAAAALTQGLLRRRAVPKFGADAERMYFTAYGVEQSTRASVAAHRAERFRALGVRRLADLCGGIGGDAIALARAGIEVLAVDRDPLTCAVARANAEALGLADRIEVRCADVTPLADISEVHTLPVGPEGPGGGAPAGPGRRPEPYDAVFADPARRTARGRTFDPEAYSPPLSWALTVARSARYAAVKVAPGIPHEAVPDDAEAEWVSDRGDVKEAALWFGTTPGGGPAAGPDGGPGGVRAVRATLLPSGAALSGAGILPDAPVRAPGRFLYEPDGAVIRAHLVAAVAEQVNGGLIDPTIAYVTADQALPTPYATAYEITDVLPFGLKKLKALLREREVGTLTVKKRGSAVEPEAVRRRVRPRGPHAATVFLTRVAGAPSMLIGRPVRP